MQTACYAGLPAAVAALNAAAVSLEENILTPAGPSRCFGCRRCLVEADEPVTLPPHRREPGARRIHRGRARHRGARLAPTGKPWRRRARIDPSHSREVLAPILKDIHEAVPHLTWTSKGPRVEAVAPDLAAPSHDAVHRLGKPDPEALHTARERAVVLRLRHQVHVISLDGELENPESAS